MPDITNTLDVKELRAARKADDDFALEKLHAALRSRAARALRSVMMQRSAAAHFLGGPIAACVRARRASKSVQHMMGASFGTKSRTALSKDDVQLVLGEQAAIKEKMQNSGRLPLIYGDNLVVKNHLTVSGARHS